MSANETQVGGLHYKTKDGKPEHWDLAIMYGWDAFQYQITKYVMRWKTKHADRAKRLEDLKKARHFLDKYIENFDVYDQNLSGMEPVKIAGLAVAQDFLKGVDGPQTVTGAKLLSHYEQEHHAYLHDDTFLCEGGYGNGTNLYTHKKTKQQVIATSLGDAHEVWSRRIDPEATPGYVNQG